MRGFYTYGFEVLDESGIEGNTLLYRARHSDMRYAKKYCTPKS